MKQFHNLITNTTSLVGYIAVLMFVGAYLGGDKSYALDPEFFKGSVLESKNVMPHVSVRSVIITIDGRQYEATIGEEVSKKPEFQY